MGGRFAVFGLLVVSIQRFSMRLSGLDTTCFRIVLPLDQPNVASSSSKGLLPPEQALARTLVAEKRRPTSPVPRSGRHNEWKNRTVPSWYQLLTCATAALSVGQLNRCAAKASTELQE